jgi:hypothetical protein
MHVLLALLSALVLTPSHALAAPTAPRCPGGRFYVAPEAGAPPLIGATAEPEVIEIRGLEAAAGVVVISSGCGRVLLGIRVTKRGAVVKAVWPPGGCRGESAVRLKATIDADCVMNGVVRKKKQKPRKFTAALSRCGDGVVDAQTEECEPQLGCVNRTCEAGCRCARPTTTTTAIVAGATTSTSTQGTVPTSTSTSSTGGQVTSTVPTSTTTTTTLPGGSCTDASAPMCSADCGSGIVCTDSLCADPDQLCSAHEDCDSGFCVFIGQFGVCAVDESCGAGDESCDSGLCVSFTSCFCWFP